MPPSHKGLRELFTYPLMSAIVDRRTRFRLDDHAVGGRGGARRLEFRRALHAHQADAARADDWKFGIPAERRDIDSKRARRVENCRAGRHRDGPPVDRQRRHEVKLRRKKY